MLLPLLFALLTGATPQNGSQLIGDWITPDHSVVRVAPCGATLCLHLVLVSPSEPGTKDMNNPDATKHGRELCGTQIGEGFTPDGPDHAKDGHIYDPKDGKTYSGEMTADGSTLKLRGYVGIPLFGRTETWQRTHKTIPPCG